MKLPCITVDLEDHQIEGIRPLMEKVAEACQCGKPGMLLAQVFNDEMKVFFATMEQAQEMQRVMGTRVGKLSNESE